MLLLIAMSAILAPHQLAAAPSIDVDLLTLSNAGSTRGTAYAAANKMVTLDGKTHIAWLDSVSVARVCTYFHDTGAVSDPVTVGEGHDNHGGPAMCADSEGYLHIVYGPHHHPFQYRRSVRPGDASEWTPVERFADKATYPSLVCDGRDTLHLTYRKSGEPWVLAYQRKPKGQPWSAPKVLLKAAANGYCQWGNPLYIDDSGRLHLGFHFYLSAVYGAGYGFGYLYSDDFGETWRTTSGNALELPAVDQTCEPIRMSKDMDIRVGTIVAHKGLVYMTVTGEYPDPQDAGQLWILNDGRWRPVDLEQFLEAPWNSIRKASVSVTSDGVLYVAATCGESGWGAEGQEIRLLVSRDGGVSFDAAPVSEVDPETPHWLENIERNTGHAPVGAPRILYTSGGRGENNRAASANEIRFAVPRMK